jgi:hypothetical protein
MGTVHLSPRPARRATFSAAAPTDVARSACADGLGLSSTGRAQRDSGMIPSVAHTEQVTDRIAGRVAILYLERQSSHEPREAGSAPPGLRLEGEPG